MITTNGSYLNNRYSCPAHVNPAEFLADLISVDYSSAESVHSSQKRIEGLVESFSEENSLILYATPLTKRDSSKTSFVSKNSVVKRNGSWWRQFWLLLKRAWLQVTPSIMLRLVAHARMHTQRYIHVHIFSV